MEKENKYVENDNVKLKETVKGLHENIASLKKRLDESQLNTKDYIYQLLKVKDVVDADVQQY